MTQDLDTSTETLPLPTALEKQAGECLRHRTLDILSSYLANIGLLNGSVSPAEWVTAHNLPSYFERWMCESMRLCASLNPERAPERSIDCAWDSWNEDRHIWIGVPELRGKGELAEVVLRALPGILRGERAPLGTIFPGASPRLVQAVYGGSRKSDYFHRVAARVAFEHIAGLCENKSGKFQILEIGAGTGSTTAFMLDALTPHAARIEQYCYTDISRAFLAPGRRRFGTGKPFLTFQPFNVEVPPERQGFKSAQFDLIIAANVLHATRRIRDSVEHASRLLADDGLLLLIEVLGSNNVMGHVTFGLLEGWWRNEDTKLRVRDGSPSVAPASWMSMLEVCGFHDICFPAERAHMLGQQIITARWAKPTSPG